MLGSKSYFVRITSAAILTVVFGCSIAHQKVAAPDPSTALVPLDASAKPAAPASKPEEPRVLDPRKDGFEIVFAVEMHFDKGTVVTAECDPVHSQGFAAMMGSKIKKAWIVPVNNRGKEGKRYPLHVIPVAPIKGQIDGHLTDMPNLSIYTNEFGEIVLYKDFTTQQEQLKESQIRKVQDYLRSKS